MLCGPLTILENNHARQVCIVDRLTEHELTGANSTDFDPIDLGICRFFSRVLQMLQADGGRKVVVYY